MAAVDEVRMALERTVPDFRDRSGDWARVLERARADERKHRRWGRWPAVAGAAVAAAAALVLFWPADRAGENVLARARAAVERGPVTHVVVRVASIEVYDLERHEYRSVPDIWEEWFDPARGFHGVQRVGSRVYQEYRGPRPATLPEGAEEFAGIATAYRRALATDNASLGAEETVQGRRVYWIRVATVLKQYEVAVDAQTFEPRFLRVEGGPVVSLQFETLGAGEGDFTVSPRRPESSSWSGTSRPGPLSPEEAGDALENALWLGERFGKVPLSSIREAEVSWSTTKLDPLGESLRALELCYGSGERCAVSLTETTEPYPLAAGGHGWDVRPPPGLLALADEPGLGYVIRNGVYVVLLAPSRGELIAAAEALTPILRKQAAGLRKETCGMSTNQIQKLVCTAAAGMAVTAGLALQAGSTASAATGTASASASEAAQGKVRIELTGRVLGPRGNRGRFILSGALADRGRFVDAPGLYIPRTLYGAKGAIRIIVGGTRGSWRITKGTKAYAGLHGRGHEHGLYDDTIHITMTGRVWR